MKEAEALGIDPARIGVAGASGGGGIAAAMTLPYAFALEVAMDELAEKERSPSRDGHAGPRSADPYRRSELSP